MLAMVDLDACRLRITSTSIFALPETLPHLHEEDHNSDKAQVRWPHDHIRGR